MSITRRGFVGSALAGLAAIGIGRTKASASVDPILPRLSEARSVEIWRREFDANVMAAITVDRECSPPIGKQLLCGEGEGDIYADDRSFRHEHGQGLYRMRGRVRQRYGGPNFARGVIFRDEADYLARGESVARELQRQAIAQAEAIVRGTAVPVGGFYSRKELEPYRYE